MWQAVAGTAPTVHESALVHPEATLIGDADWGVAADRYIERAERYRESARPVED